MNVRFSEPSRKNVAIIFHYFERDMIYRDNLLFFLSVGLNKDNNFFIVKSSDCSIDIPELPNLRIIDSENINHDYGGFQKFIEVIGTEYYDYYLFINSSSRGPFCPNYLEKSWIDIFLDKLTSDIGVAGCTINILPKQTAKARAYCERRDQEKRPLPHVQTMAYALTKEAIQFLKKSGFYNIKRRIRKARLIQDYEIELSQRLIEAGWNISSIVPVYDLEDYRIGLNEDSHFRPPEGNPLHRGKFFGRNLGPLDTIFLKTHWKLLSELDLASYTYTMLEIADTLPDLQELKNNFQRRCYSKIFDS